MDYSSLQITETLNPGTRKDSELISLLKSVIPALMKADRIPGLSIALARHGHTVWECGFGFADLREQRPMTPGTIFPSGCLAKPIAGIAVMQLQERGLIDLDAPARLYLPFPLDNPLGGTVRVRDLMTHRSGLASWDHVGACSSPPRPLRQLLEETLNARRLPHYQGDYSRLWATPVGEQLAYSGIGIALLGLIVETVNEDRLSYAEYVNAHVLKPLKMSSSWFTDDPDIGKMNGSMKERLSTGYVAMGNALFPSPQIYYGLYPAGAFYYTSSDYVRLLTAMLNGGKFEGGALLNPGSVREILNPCSEQKVPLTGFRQSLVWLLDHCDGLRASFGHTGNHAYGWRNAAVAWRNFDTAAVISINCLGVPHRFGELHQIIEIIGNRLYSAAPDFEPETTDDWPWKLSYCRGLIAYEAFNGWLGLPDPLDKGSFRDMGANPYLVDENREDWNQDGFLQAIDDMSTVHLSKQGLTGFLDSDIVKVTREELELACFELGCEPRRSCYLSVLLEEAASGNA